MIVAGTAAASADHATAVEQLTDAVQVSRTNGFNHVFARSTYELAKLYRDAGNLEKAESFSSNAVQTMRRLEDRFHLPEHLALLADVKTRKGEFEHADQLYTEATDLIDALLVNVTSQQLKSSLIATLSDAYVGHFQLAATRSSNAARAFDIIDLHSGKFGGVVHNPLQARCEIIAKLHDAEGHVAIPHFYGRVRRWNEVERDHMRETGPSNEEIIQNAGVPEPRGERKYTLYEHTTVRPSIAVAGIVVGHQGPGVKRVMPSRALAKINIRLVHDQEPQEIDKLARQHVARVTPPTVKTVIRTYAAVKPVVMDTRCELMKTAAVDYRRGFGTLSVFLRAGGTIPVVSIQRSAEHPYGSDGLCTFGRSIHAPNKKIPSPEFLSRDHHEFVVYGRDGSVGACL